MTDRQICQNCRWWKMFVPKDPETGDTANDWKEGNVFHTGQCRRNPPGKGNGQGPCSTGVDWHGSWWHHTQPFDWCGEWSERDPE